MNLADIPLQSWIDIVHDAAKATGVPAPVADVARFAIELFSRLGPVLQEEKLPELKSARYPSLFDALLRAETKLVDEASVADDDPSAPGKIDKIEALLGVLPANSLEREAFLSLRERLYEERGEIAPALTEDA